MPQPQPACFGALALELRPDAHAANAMLEPAAAAELAEGIARDLAILVPDAATLDLVVLAAHYDPAELLRPGWPLHAALDALAVRAPGALDRALDDGRILAFGASDGALPGSVPTPDPDFAGGTMRMLPFVLRGDTTSHARVEQVGQALEEVLIDRGMAGAATALFAQQSFGARIEHARYLTVLDIAALMAMQYEHVGLALLWPLIEAALLAPEAQAWLDAPPEPLAQYANGGVRIALIDSESWRNGGFAPASVGEDPDKLERAFEHFEARKRQIAAVLAAHAIPVTFDHCPAGKDPRVVLQV